MAQIKFDNKLQFDPNKLRQTLARTYPDSEKDISQEPETATEQYETPDIGSVITSGHPFKTRKGSIIKIIEPLASISSNGSFSLAFKYEYQTPDGKKGISSATASSIYDMLMEK